jgi:hypothetical protein
MIEVVDESFKNHWAPGLSNEAHHADITAVGSSGARCLIEETPAHFHAKYITREAKDETTDAQRIGTNVHLGLLQPTEYLQRYKIMPDFGDQRSSSNREAKQLWLKKQPKECVLATKDEYNMTMSMIYSVLNNPVAKGTISGGIPERTGYFRDPDTGIKCKIRPDLTNEITMRDSSGKDIVKHALIDFKTARSAKWVDFQKSIANYRYDVQMAFYCDGYEAITGVKIDFPLYVVCEKTAPYAAALYHLGAESMERGRRDYKAALKKLRACLDKGEWHGYDPIAHPIELPYWYFNNENVDL